MKNFEKYKSAQSRNEAFGKWCRDHYQTWCNTNDKSCTECQFAWLDLEAEEEEMPLPCPFCGGKCELHEIWDKEECRSVGHNVRCTMCEYKSPWACEYDGSDAIAAHNRVSRAVMDAEKEGDK